MKEKCKILFVIYGLGMGGAEKSLVNLLQEINYEKFEVDLYLFDYLETREDNGKRKELPSKVNFIVPDDDVKFLTTKRYKNLIKYFSFKRLFYLLISKIKARKFKDQYKRNQVLWKSSYSKLVKKIDKEYDCAVSFMHSYPNYFVIEKVKAKKKILWVHTDYSILASNKNFDYDYFNKADKVVTISERCLYELELAFPSIKNTFLSLYNLIPIKRIKDLSNQYIPEYFNDDCINLLSIGRLVHLKGFDIAIKAAKELKKANVKFKWVILGEGEERENLEDMIDDEIKDDVFLPGNNYNPYPYFKKCNFVIQTSLYEGKSIVLDEAKIFEKPIICTEYNTVRDQIVDEYNGIIVPLNDFIAIKNKIIELAENDNLRMKIIENLKKEKFVSIDDYENLFLDEEIKNG